MRATLGTFTSMTLGMEASPWLIRPLVRSEMCNRGSTCYGHLRRADSPPEAGARAHSGESASGRGTAGPGPDPAEGDPRARRGRHGHPLRHKHAGQDGIPRPGPGRLRSRMRDTPVNGEPFKGAGNRRRQAGMPAPVLRAGRPAHERGGLS
ncbi:hypothetical protein GCM10010327_60930 [Streptomyces nitrosporeus]|nr:hypothetical protein GCM10010327_60930 [Streptomyces nitrosporeus]